MDLSTVCIQLSTVWKANLSTDFRAALFRGSSASTALCPLFARGVEASYFFLWYALSSWRAFPSITDVQTIARTTINSSAMTLTIEAQATIAVLLYCRVMKLNRTVLEFAVSRVILIIYNKSIFMLKL